jgi:formiminotetrahydrofolate cyclodeaminase
MSEYGDMTLDAYRDALASNQPTPGGGSAAAVALSQAAALTIMVCELTLKGEKWIEGHEIATETRALATPLLERGHELAHEDAHSFDGVMAAFRMPKESDDEKAARRAAIHAGTLVAAEVPLETANAAFELLTALSGLAVHGNANAVTDVGVAGLLASAACKGALFNVEINLLGLPEDVGGELRDAHDALKSRCKDESRAVMQAVNSRMHD